MAEKPNIRIAICFVYYISYTIKHYDSRWPLKVCCDVNFLSIVVSKLLHPTRALLSPYTSHINNEPHQRLNLPDTQQYIYYVLSVSMQVNSMTIFYPCYVNTLRPQWLSICIWHFHRISFYYPTFTEDGSHGPLAHWQIINTTLEWRHDDRDGVSNHQRLDCLLNRLFGRRSKKTSKIRVTGICGEIHRWPVN